MSCYPSSTQRRHWTLSADEIARRRSEARARAIDAANEARAARVGGAPSGEARRSIRPPRTRSPPPAVLRGQDPEGVQAFSLTTKVRATWWRSSSDSLTRTSPLDRSAAPEGHHAHLHIRRVQGGGELRQRRGDRQGHAGGPQQGARRGALHSSSRLPSSEAAHFFTEPSMFSKGARDDRSQNPPTASPARTRERMPSCSRTRLVPSFAGRSRARRESRAAAEVGHGPATRTRCSTARPRFARTKCTTKGKGRRVTSRRSSDGGGGARDAGRRADEDAGSRADKKPPRGTGATASSGRAGGGDGAGVAGRGGAREGRRKSAADERRRKEEAEDAALDGGPRPLGGFFLIFKRRSPPP